MNRECASQRPLPRAAVWALEMKRGGVPCLLACRHCGASCLLGCFGNEAPVHGGNETRQPAAVETRGVGHDLQAAQKGQATNLTELPKAGRDAVHGEREQLNASISKLLLCPRTAAGL